MMQQRSRLASASSQGHLAICDAMHCTMGIDMLDSAMPGDPCLLETMELGLVGSMRPPQLQPQQPRSSEQPCPLQPIAEQAQSQSATAPGSLVPQRASPAFASSASTPGASSSWQGPVVAASASSRGPDVADLVRLASSSYAPTLDPTGLATTHPIRFIESDWNQEKIDALSEKMMADEAYRDSFWSHWAFAGMYGDSTDDDEPYRDELGDHLGHSSSAVDAFALTPSQWHVTHQDRDRRGQRLCVIAGHSDRHRDRRSKPWAPRRPSL